MGKFEQYTNNIFGGKTPIEFTFRGAKDLISKYESLSGDRLKENWHYCIREHKRPNGKVEKLLVKVSLTEDSWATLGALTNCTRDVKLPKFNEVYGQRKVIR